MILHPVRAAIESLRESRSRTILSSLGITVGALAITLLISVARGVQDDMKREVEDLGVNVMIVLPTRLEEGQMFAPGIMGISYLAETDVDRVLRVPGVRSATPLTFVGTGLNREGRTSPTTMILAVRPQWFDMRPVKLAEGSVYGPQSAGESVCVIGSIAKERLFGDKSALGQTIEYNGQVFRVIGVTETKAESSSLFQMGSFENVMYVPFDAMKSKQPTMQIDRIMVQTSADREPQSLVNALDTALSERLSRETYSVLTQQDLLKLVFKLMDILTWLLLGLTSIALLVGGVGIMAIMLMAVTQRTKEIGIRKTVGARRTDIFRQFLAEALILGFVGGAAGLGLSALVSWGLTTYTPIHPLIELKTVALSFGVCLGVGAIAGLVPALKAARQDPVASLRIE